MLNCLDQCPPLDVSHTLSKTNNISSADVSAVREISRHESVKFFWVSKQDQNCIFHFFFFFENVGSNTGQFQFSTKSAQMTVSQL